VPRHDRTLHKAVQNRFVVLAAVSGSPQWPQLRQARNAVRRRLRALLEPPRFR
jgi:hypothetical protein